MPVEAVYQGGVIKPLRPLNLKDGERVKVEVIRDFIEASFGILRQRKMGIKELEEAYYDYILERAGPR
jgi:predicted DNA-binding antitoxin AbrB/MazE fold protein